MEMAEDDDLAIGELGGHRLIEQVELRGVVSRSDIAVLQGMALVSVLQSDSAAADLDDRACCKFACDTWRIHVSGNGDCRRDSLQCRNDIERDEIPGVEDAIDSGKPIKQSFGEPAYRDRDMRIRHKADADMS